jgi:hypothetical protein
MNTFDTTCKQIRVHPPDTMHRSICRPPLTLMIVKRAAQLFLYNKKNLILLCVIPLVVEDPGQVWYLMYIHLPH